MKIDEALCRAFCDGITISAVPAGRAVSTPFEDMAGERIGFYLIEDKHSGLYRLEDDGELVPSLLATGTNLLKGARAKQFQAMLRAGNVEFDPESGELRTAFMEETQVPLAAMNFVALLLRVASLSVMHPDIVGRNFRDDAVARIRADLSASFDIQEGEDAKASLPPDLSEFDPDVYLRAPNKTPVAVFVGMSDQRLSDAVIMQMAANYEATSPCSVVALVDREKSKLTTHKGRQRARNRLPAVPEFYGEESQAVRRIADEANKTKLAH